MLVALALALSAVGVLSVMSASYAGDKELMGPLVEHQILWVGIGTVLMFAVAMADYRTLSTYAYPLYLLTVVLLVAAAIIGHSAGGSRRWINLGAIKLEPSELAKIAIVLVLARHMRGEVPRGGWRLHQMIVPVLLLAIPVGLVLKQPDLGTALVLMLVTATLVFVGGINWRIATAVALVALLVAPFGWHFLKPYQRERLVSFLNPHADPLGTGYHVIQSEIAIGAGGPWGKGLLQGTQARLNFLPEQTTDFIFSVYAEEFGFAGSLVLLGLYSAIVARGAWVARHARDRFGSLLAAGVVAILFWEASINIGMASGILPVVGIPLPMVSYGGSSLIAMMAGVGLLIGVSSRRHVF